MLLCIKKMLPFKEYRNFSGNLNDKCKYLTDVFGIGIHIYREVKMEKYCACDILKLLTCSNIYSTSE